MVETFSFGKTVIMFGLKCVDSPRQEVFFFQLEITPPPQVTERTLISKCFKYGHNYNDSDKSWL